MTKKSLILLSSLTGLFLIFLIAPLCQLTGLSQIYQNKQLWMDISNFTEGFPINNHTSILNFINVTFGLAGVHVFFQIFCTDPNITFFIVSLYFISPILGVMLFILLCYHGCNFFISKFAEWRIKSFNQLSTIWFIAAGITTFISLFIGLIFVYSNDSSSLFANYETQTYSGYEGIYLFSNKMIAPNSMNYLSTTLFNFGLGDLMNSVDCTTLFKVGAVMLLFVAPISALIFVLASVVKMVTYLNLNYGGLYQGLQKKLTNWLNFSDIASGRELKSRLITNKGLILTFITFLVMFIFPALTPNIWNDKQSIAIICSSVILMILSFAPMLYMFIRMKQMKKYSYNLLIFIQMIIWSSLAFIWQILMWSIYGGMINTYPIIIGAVMLMLLSLSIITSFCLLIYSKKR